MDPTNPYLATIHSTQTDTMGAETPMMSPEDAKRLEAVIKDANQFWLAILLVFVCTCLGSIIIGPWYFVRFLQWQKLAEKYPGLLNVPVPLGSLADRFQRAKLKLLAGAISGLLILLAIGSLVVLAFITG